MRATVRKQNPKNKIFQSVTFAHCNSKHIHDGKTRPRANQENDPTYPKFPDWRPTNAGSLVTQDDRSIWSPFSISVTTNPLSIMVAIKSFFFLSEKKVPNSTNHGHESLTEAQSPVKGDTQSNNTHINLPKIRKESRTIGQTGKMETRSRAHQKADDIPKIWATRKIGFSWDLIARLSSQLLKNGEKLWSPFQVGCWLLVVGSLGRITYI